MKPLYEQMFNEQYVNAAYLQSLQQQYHLEQRAEITKAVKAIRDYCEAVCKIAPEYQQAAFMECAAAVLEEMGR